MKPLVLRVGPWLFRAGAISNFIVTIPAFVAYNAYVSALTSPAPNYPFLIWIWSGMAFLWGVMFWEVSGDLVGRRRLIKYAYLEKSITSLSVLTAYATGSVSLGSVIGIAFTDIIWIPMFIAVHVGVARLKPGPAAA